MKQVLLVFKDKKKITKNHEFWDDKLSLKFIVHKIFLTDLLHLTNLEIIKLINKKIFTKKIDFTIFEGDHVDIIDETFLYNAKENFELKTLTSENLKNQLYKYPLMKFFLISEKNISENEKLIKSAKKSCEINEIAKTYLIRDIFNWQNPDNFRIKQNFKLYEVSKCLDYS